VDPSIPPETVVHDKTMASPFKSTKQGSGRPGIQQSHLVLHCGPA
jgi:hypothetical protein